jgi:hypothetical protein
MEEIVMNKGSRLLAVAFCAAALALLVSPLFVGSALAAKSKSIKTEAKFVSYDDSTKTMTVKVKSTGKKPKNKALKLKNGKEAEFRIKPDGSILTKTSVTLNGKRSAIGEIPKGKTINIYWVPDEKDENVRFARKIDMILSDEELEARDKQRMKEAEAAGKVGGGE